MNQAVLPPVVRATRKLKAMVNGSMVAEEPTHEFTRQALDQICSQNKVKRVVPIVTAGHAFYRHFIANTPQARGLELVPSLYVRRDPRAGRAYVAGRPSVDEMAYALWRNNGQWLLVDGVVGDGAVLKTAAQWLIEQGVPRESILAMAAFCDSGFAIGDMPISPEQYHAVFWGESAPGCVAELCVPVFLPHPKNPELAGVFFNSARI